MARNKNQVQLEDSDSDSDTNQDTRSDPDAVLKEKLQEIALKLSRQDYAKELKENEKKQQEFLREYEGFIARKPPAKHENVLHFMAAKRCATFPWLIRHVLENYKERMDDLDNASRRPLTVAIVLKGRAFIKAVLKTNYSNLRLESILKAKTEDIGNGIHTAIASGLSPPVIIQLIERLSDDSDVLKAQDGAGRTPLHLAVEYQRCTPAGISIVKALLEKGDSALDIVANNKLSVYLHHHASRPKSTGGKPTINQGLGKIPLHGPRGIGGLGVPGPPASQQEKQKGDEGDKKRKELDENKGDKKDMHRDKDGGSHEPPNLLTMAGHRRPTWNTSAASPTPASPAGYQANESRKASFSMQPPALPTQVAATASWIAPMGPPPTPSIAANTASNPVTANTSSEKQETSGVSIDVADEIAKEIKLHYLRSTFTNTRRSHHTAVNFLYGESQSAAKHIAFDLLGKEGPVQLHGETYYSKLEYDSALQVVAIGAKVTVKPVGKTTVEKGRRDLVPLFTWLSEKKKVTSITKVIVEDQGDSYPSQGDEAIIKALSLFQIDILDWRKPDLCPITIQKACPSVYKLHLTWSGLNGMLLAWGGKDGLANLPNLVDIHLEQTKHLDSKEWVDARLEEFKGRLGASRRQIDETAELETMESEEPAPEDDDGSFITVHPPKARQTGGGEHSTPVAAAQEPKKDNGGFKQHEWLQIMNSFAEGVLTLRPDQYVQKLPSLPAELTRDIRICLIDDGVEAEHKRISDRVDGGGMAFGTYPRDEFPGMTRPYYLSTTNHGTLMASLILSVCPFAKITSYRLDTRPGQDKGVHFTAKSAAKALSYAATQDFDIISMSWTVKKEGTKEGENNHDDIAELVTALTQAAKKMPVFCSAPDKGELSKVEFESYFPVGADVKGIFKIGASTADNTASLPAGQNNVDYILPGQQVKVTNDDDTIILKGRSEIETGSSLATALAAGLAALMMHIVRMDAIRTYQQSKKFDSKRLNHIRSPANMRKMFDRMKPKDGKYVHVYDIFDNKGDQLVNAGDSEELTEEEQRWAIISELAVKFCGV